MEQSMEGPNIMTAMNDELLSMAAPKEEPAPEPAAKVGSKKYLVDQIVRITEAAGLPLQDSCRDMMRMKKQQLQGLVTDYVAASQRKEMADRLGAKFQGNFFYRILWLHVDHLVLPSPPVLSKLLAF